MTNSITVNSPTTNSSNSTPSSSRPVLSRLHLPLKQCVLLVAAGEQEDFRSFSAPQKSIAAFGSLAVPASQKTNLLGHSPHLGGPFSRVGPSGRLDGLRFIEDDVIEFDILEFRGVAPQRAVGRQNHVAVGEAIHVARQAGVVEHP